MIYDRRLGLLRIGGLLVVLGSTLLGCASNGPAPEGTASGTPSASSSSSPASSTSTTPPATRPSTTVRPTATGAPVVAKTTITLRVVGDCDDCQFQAYLTRNGRTTKYATPRRWLDRTPSWTIATSLTRNFAIGFTDLPPDTVNNQPTMVVLQYEGVSRGATLTPAQARTQSSGSYCWRGTTARSYRITVRVATIEVSNPDEDQRATDPTVPQKLVYATPLVGNAGRFHPTFAGGLGTRTPRCP